ncbi:MAG: ATP-dependent helicase RecG [Rickettsiaceae bacterium]|jgi:ATP-dependent DNA helicase RecG|nr:ATP-dependent helicase RecG [Rickettsiaceae bacterium]
MHPIIKELSNKVEDVLKLRKPIIDALKRLGIISFRDLIFYKPSYVMPRKLFPDLRKVQTGDNIVAEVEIKEIALAKISSRTPTKIYCENSHGQGLILVYFNRIPPFILSSLKIGSKKIVTGKVERHFDYIQITHPEYLLRKEGLSELEPVYPLTYAINNRLLSNLIQIALKRLPIFEEWLPQSIVDKFNLMSFNDAIYLLHNPSKSEALNKKAIRRLACDEIFANQLMLAYIRRLRQSVNGQSFMKAANLQEKILNNLGFLLTESQLEAIKEIEKDQASPAKMMRLLQGDVGAGKTLVALMTMLNVVASNAQTALMVPTDILANQHFTFFKKALEGTDIKVALLTGKTKLKERKEILENLASNEIKIIIGTHALFQEKVEFANLGYVVIDEQHRFGVEQRLELMEKGNKADVLIMTATPIPRSLNLVLFGDMEASKLLSKPKGRLPILTSCISEKKVADLIASLSKILKQGQKIYWVCALIEKKDTDDNEVMPDDYAITDAAQRASILEMHYPGRVAIIHGKMQAFSKEAVMEEFRNGAKDILVATTVIEVGVDVPSASLIIIENAEKFGLAQLHQLRGRVGRGAIQSHCVLIYGSRVSSVAKQRLSIMKNTNDGFFIAEEDLKLRGGGEILGTKQSGEQTFFIAEFLRDFDVLNAVNEWTCDNINNHEKLDKTKLIILFTLMGYRDSAKFLNLN